MKNNIIIKFKTYTEFILFLIFFIISSILPISFVSFFGGTIFKIIGPFTTTNKIVIKNIIKIFPEATKSEIIKYVKESWLNTGRTFFELMKLPNIINSNKLITIEGKEIIDEIIQNDEKVIFVGIHQSNWEILLPTIDKLGIKVGGIYRHINNPYINKFILYLRNKSISSKKSFYTPKGIKSAKEILNGIRENKSFVLLIDQRDSAGEIVEFFGFPSKTQTGFIKISKKYKMKIIPVENLRIKNNKFKLKFHKPILDFHTKKSDNEIMLELHSIIEKWIKNKISHWFLQHNRFK